MKKMILSAALLAVATSGALAADLPSRKMAIAPVVYAPVFTWTGFYVGVNAGYRFGDNPTDFYYTPAVGSLLPASLKNDRDGFTGGVQAGYNYQINQIVLGVEGDINYIGGKKGAGYGTTVGGFTSAVSTQTSGDYLGTLRGRVGFAADRFLVYATGGLAFGEVKNDTRIFVNNGIGVGTWSGSSSDTKVGWTLGAGVEYAFTNNITAKLEYLYYDLGEQNTVLFRDAAAAAIGVTTTTKTKSDGNIVRAGLNYKF